MKAMLQEAIEKAEQRDIDLMQQDFERIQSDVTYFQSILAQKQSDYQAGILNRSVDASANLRKDLDAVADIIRENQRLATEKRQYIDTVLGARATAQALERARAEVRSLENERTEIEASIEQMRAVLSSLPPQISRAEWAWNQVLWKLSAAKDVLQNLERQREKSL
jgi:predicted nuclease with TOPRIM domain